MEWLAMALAALQSGAKIAQNETANSGATFVNSSKTDKQKAGEAAQPAQQASPNPEQPGQPQQNDKYRKAFESILSRIFAPTNINPPAARQQTGPGPRPTMPDQDPYGFGSYY